MSDHSAQVDDLKRLIHELTDELEGLQTSADDESGEPRRIRKRTLYEAVQAVERHFRDAKLPVRPRRAWIEMLRRADDGLGESESSERNLRYYEFCETLLAWAEAEMALLQPANDEPLSVRQEEVDAFVRRKGFASGKEIANHLGVEESTVRKHLIPPLKKRGLRNKKGQGYYFPNGRTTAL